MHPNPIFRSTRHDQNLAFAAARGFGVLAISQPGPPLLSHVPFLLSSDGATAELHLVRSNPVARAVAAPTPACLAVSGPDSYVSPDWYQLDEQVPTWNYVAVHLAGLLEPLPQGEIRGVLERLSAEFEARLAPKPEWLLGKTAAEILEKMMRMVRPFVFHIEDVDGTWKLSQNKPEVARLAAADQVARHGIGQGQESLAELMQTAIMETD